MIDEAVNTPIMPLAGGFLTVVAFCFILKAFMKVMKSPLNSLPSSQTYLAGRGYLFNQYWFIHIELKLSLGIGAISNQPVAGSIIIKAWLVISFALGLFLPRWLPFFLLLPFNSRALCSPHKRGSTV